jgi:soluble lytic murein transglycosylase-like protein
MKLQSAGRRAPNQRANELPDSHSEKTLAVVRLRRLMVLLSLCAGLGTTTPVLAASPSQHRVTPPAEISTGLPQHGEEPGNGTSAQIFRWSPFIKEASRRFGVAEDWIKAVMRMESGGHTTAADGSPITSRAGAMGLMQLMPETWRDMQRAYSLGKDPYDPHDNVLAGTAYLRWLYEKFGYPQMFAAYNAGPGTVDAQSAGFRELPEETRNYLTGITRILGTADTVATDSPKSRTRTIQVAQAQRGTAALTRPDGSGVSVDPASVTGVRAALPDEYTPGVQTVISMGPHVNQGVLESPAKVEALLRQHGARV